MNITRTVELGPKARLLVTKDEQLLDEANAEMIAQAAHEAIAKRGRFTIALSGGAAPKPLYELMAEEPWRSHIDWSRTHFFWGDERFVPPTDSQSNFKLANDAWLSRIPVRPENIHRVPTQPLEPEEAAKKYEDEIREFFGAHPQVDFNLLGVGTNGHTASLFPHRPTLDIRDRLVISDYIPEVKMNRITWTVPFINASRIILFLVAGKDKASIMHEVLRGPRDPQRLPSQLIHPEGGTLTWLADEAAAAEVH